MLLHQDIVETREHPAAPRGPRRRRRRVLWLAGLVGIGVGVCASAAVRPLSGRTLRVAERLPGGGTLRLEGVSYGRRHRVVPGGSPWSGVATLFPALQGLLKTPSPVEFATGRDTLGLWLSYRGDINSAWFLNYMTLVDAHGCPFRCRTAPSSTRRIDEGLLWGTSLDAYPTRSESFQLRLQVGGPEDHRVHLDVVNPLAARRFPVWSAEPLPTERRAPGLALTLERVSTWLLDGGDDSYSVPQARATLSLSQAGRPLRDWRVNSVAVSDATGNTLTTTNRRDDPTPDRVAMEGLCAWEPCWKIRLRLLRAPEAALFEPDEITRVDDTVVPSPGKWTGLPPSPGHQGLRMQLGHLRSSDKPSRIVVTAWGLKPEERLVLWATDERGRKASAASYAAGEASPAARRFIELDALAGARRVDLRYVVDTSREVEFAIQPPPPRRIANPMACVRRGDLQEAAGAYRQRIASDPDEAWSYNNLAWMYLTHSGIRQDPAEVVRLAERASALSHREANILNTLGVAYYRAGRYADAARTLRRAVAANNQGGTAFDYFFLAMSSHRLGQAARARQYYRQADNWWQARANRMSPDWTRELTQFRAEADRTLSD